MEKDGDVIEELPVQEDNANSIMSEKCIQQKRETSVVCIQRIYRGVLVRRDLVVRDQSALKIQCAWIAFCLHKVFVASEDVERLSSLEVVDVDVVVPAPHDELAGRARRGVDGEVVGVRPDGRVRLEGELDRPGRLGGLLQHALPRPASDVTHGPWNRER